jgi:hypothetical protein
MTFGSGAVLLSGDESEGLTMEKVRRAIRHPNNRDIPA